MNRYESVNSIGYHYYAIEKVILALLPLLPSAFLKIPSS